MSRSEEQLGDLLSAANHMLRGGVTGTLYTCDVMTSSCKQRRETYPVEVDEEAGDAKRGEQRKHLDVVALDAKRINLRAAEACHRLALCEEGLVVPRMCLSHK